MEKEQTTCTTSADNARLLSSGRWQSCSSLMEGSAIILRGGSARRVIIMCREAGEEENETQFNGYKYTVELYEGGAYASFYVVAHYKEGIFRIDPEVPENMCPAPHTLLRGLGLTPEGSADLSLIKYAYPKPEALELLEHDGIIYASLGTIAIEIRGQPNNVGEIKFLLPYFRIGDEIVEVADNFLCNKLRHKTSVMEFDYIMDTDLEQKPVLAAMCRDGVFYDVNKLIFTRPDPQAEHPDANISLYSCVNRSAPQQRFALIRYHPGSERWEFECLALEENYDKIIKDFPTLMQGVTQQTTGYTTEVALRRTENQP